MKEALDAMGEHWAITTMLVLLVAVSIETVCTMIVNIVKVLKQKS